MENIVTPKLNPIVLMFAIAAAVFFCAGWISPMWAFLLQQTLLRHLKSSHKDRWKYITMTMFGPGTRNTKRVFKYVFDDQDMEDLIVRNHKFRLRNLTMFCLEPRLTSAAKEAVLPDGIDGRRGCKKHGFCERNPPFWREIFW